jgi:hypothetical protein
MRWEGSIDYYGYYIEPKDLWGYYCPWIIPEDFPSTLPANDFNSNGSKIRVIGNDVSLPYEDFPYAAAWSLESMNFPNGMNIRWIYEANRYDMCNGVDVKVGGEPRYGGGIRVKKVVYGNGMGKEENISYFTAVRL